MSSKPTIHASNPKWDGPLCRYEPTPMDRAWGRHQTFLISQQPEQLDVTCVKCLQRLGRKPAPRMPGQSYVGNGSQRPAAASLQTLPFRRLPY